jgi:hypothetical protein
MAEFLSQAWLSGIRSGQARMQARTTATTTNICAVALHHFETDFKDLMEGFAEEMNLTLGTTIAAWNYLSRAWMAGAKFWEVEISARVIESQTGGFDEALRRFEE